MLVRVNLNCKVLGREYHRGDVVELDQTTAAYFEVAHNVHQAAGIGMLSHFTPINESYKAYLEVEEYLDEKGVENYIGMPVNLEEAERIGDVRMTLGSRSNKNEHPTLILWDVPHRLFHEVVVPGLIDVCRRVGVRIQAQKYEREGDGRSLQAVLRCKPKKSQEELFREYLEQS